MTFSCGTDGRDEVDAIIIRPQRDDVDVRGGWTEWYVFCLRVWATNEARSG